MKKAKWQKKLTMKEIRHIKETTDNGLLREFKENAEKHVQWRRDFPKNEPCWECKMIAQKLGLEV